MRFALRGGMLHVPHHTDDLAPRGSAAGSISGARLQPFAQRLFAMEEFLDESLVYDHDLRRVHSVRVGEIPPFEQRSLHGMEVVRRDRRKVRLRLLPFGNRPLRVLEADRRLIGAHGQEHRAARCLYARQRPQLFEILTIKLRPRVLIPQIGRLEHKGQKMVRIEPWVGPGQIEKAGDE